MSYWKSALLNYYELYGYLKAQGGGILILIIFLVPLGFAIDLIRWPFSKGKY